MLPMDLNLEPQLVSALLGFTQRMQNRSTAAVSIKRVKSPRKSRYVQAVLPIELLQLNMKNAFRLIGVSYLKGRSKPTRRTGVHIAPAEIVFSGDRETPAVTSGASMGNSELVREEFEQTKR